MPMNTSTSSVQHIEVEWHQLELRYQHLRIRTQAVQQRLMLSIHTHGLLVPIVVVSSVGSDSSWVVIDGYLRVNATQALGNDMIKAQVWELSVAEALLYAYHNNKVRPWDCLEEAHLLQELISCHQYSQAQLAACLGKSESWVTYRLQLLNALPEFMQEAIYRGRLSRWSASRILAPFARANVEHAKKLTQYLEVHSQASRDIQAFYQHYLRSNKKVREHLVEYPQLFFKSLELSKQDELSKQLLQFSPEAIWEKKLEQISHMLHALESIMPAVFYPQQTAIERAALKEQLHQVSVTMNALQQSLQRRIDAQTTLSTDGAAPTSGGQEQSRNQPALENLA